ncbi:MAG: DUF4373 domain-containing protein [Sphingobacteriales bacterium]|nr:MAG: DUF4373 domain-containing protein [Sphingobacteriales bacterium]
MSKLTGFRHPLNTRHDDRMATLLADHGAMGYGVYWIVVEYIYRQDDRRIPYTDKTIRRLASLAGMEQRLFQNLLQEMIAHYDLFIIDDFHLSTALTYCKPRKKKEPEQPGNEALSDNSADDTKCSTPPSPIRWSASAEKQPPAGLMARNAAKMAENTAAPQQHNSSTTAAGQQHGSTVAAPQRQHNSSITAPLQQRSRTSSEEQKKPIPPSKPFF